MQSWLELVFVFLLVLFVASLILLLPRGRYGAKGTVRNRTQILVLGDIGRSPRMQNHAISMLKIGVPVDLIGYIESELHPQLRDQKNLTVHPLARPPALLQAGGKAAFLVTGPLKVIWQLWDLWVLLGRRTPPPRWLLVQNPPSIPTLAVAAGVCFFRRTRLAVDWHNFGYTILALKLGDGHPMVWISRAYERFFARYANANFAVSEAMCRRMARDFRLRTRVARLYDRPTDDFRPLSEQARRRFVAEMDLGLEEGMRVQLREGKVKVLVSSTSWTADEDFGILLDALVEYDGRRKAGKELLPELLVVITGKGPLKEMYLGKIRELEKAGKLENVTIKTAWLSTENYAGLLASADLGVSLHQSSSGVDLPMKVVDMFGAGLPVAGWSRYESWPELVKNDVNGKNFGSTSELRDALIQLLGGDGEKLKRLRAGVLKEGRHRWQSEWESVAGKTFGYIR